MWNAVTYFNALNGKLKITKDNYTFCRVTGINYLEEILSSPQSAKSFLAVDDTDEGVTVQNGGGYFNRRAVVVYILKKYDFKSQTDREEKTNETRLIYQKILSRLIKDSSLIAELNFLDKTRFPYHEVPGYFAAGTTGIYFTLTLDEPTNLVYDAEDWES